MLRSRGSQHLALIFNWPSDLARLSRPALRRTVSHRVSFRPIATCGPTSSRRLVGIGISSWPARAPCEAPSDPAWAGPRLALSAHMRTRLLRLVIASATICSSWVITPNAQENLSQPQGTFRGAVDVVTIQASVRDARGRVVSGLTSTDFEVRDNGQLRPILSLRSDRQSPLSLAILVDMSGSMRVGPKIAMARQAYRFDPVAAPPRAG